MTGRSLPGDLQRLLGARRTAGARSPSAGISKARSGCGPDGRLRGSGSDAPPAPGPRPGPASRAPARAPRLRAVQAARPPAEGGGPLALSAPGGSAPRSPSALRPGSLPSLPAGSRPPFSRRSLSVPSSALPRPRLRWRGPGLPPQAKAADALSQPGPPGYFSNAVTVFKTQGEKTCTETKRASSVRAKLASHTGTAAGLPPPRARRLERAPRAQCPAPALPGLTFPGVSTQRYATPYLSPSPGRGCPARLEGATPASAPAWAGVSPPVNHYFPCPESLTQHGVNDQVHGSYTSAWRPRLPGRRRSAPTPPAPNAPLSRTPRVSSSLSPAHSMQASSSPQN